MHYELFYFYSPHASNKWDETEFDCITLDFLAIPRERVAEFPFLQQLEQPRMHHQVTDLALALCTVMRELKSTDTLETLEGNHKP